MITTIRLPFAFCLIFVFCLFSSQSASAQERLCDPSFEYCYAGLLELVQKETVGIDMAITPFYNFEVVFVGRGK